MSDPAIVNVIELAKGFYEEGVAVLPTAAGTGFCIKALFAKRPKMKEVKYV